MMPQGCQIWSALRIFGGVDPSTMEGLVIGAEEFWGHQYLHRRIINRNELQIKKRVQVCSQQQPVLGDISLITSIGQCGKTCVGNEILESSAQFQPRQPTSPSKTRACLFATYPEQMTQAIALTHTGHIGRGRANVSDRRSEASSRFSVRS
jgi:hypothetical protein